MRRDRRLLSERAGSGSFSADSSGSNPTPPKHASQTTHTSPSPDESSIGGPTRMNFQTEGPSSSLSQPVSQQISQPLLSQMMNPPMGSTLGQSMSQPPGQSFNLPLGQPAAEAGPSHSIGGSGFPRQGSASHPQFSKEVSDVLGHGPGGIGQLLDLQELASTRPAQPPVSVERGGSSQGAEAFKLTASEPLRRGPGEFQRFTSEPVAELGPDFLATSSSDGGAGEAGPSRYPASGSRSYQKKEELFSGLDLGVMKSAGAKASDSDDLLRQRTPNPREAAANRRMRRQKMQAKRSASALLMGRGGDRPGVRRGSRRNREQEQDRKAERLLRNREAAIRSRLAAKEKQQVLQKEFKELQERVADLERMNMKLKMEFQTLYEAYTNGTLTTQSQLTEMERESVLHTLGRTTENVRQHTSEGSDSQTERDIKDS